MILELLKGDITLVQADAIVNAANSSLLGGGGVDGAIHAAAGSAVLEECYLLRNKQGGCKVGEAVLTTAGKLKAKKIIHTVGPTWDNGLSGEEEKLRSCYLECLKLAESNHLRTIAFPNISTGVYRFPKQKAAAIALEAVQSWAGNFVDKVIFVCFDDENYQIYRQLLK